MSVLSLLEYRDASTESQVYGNGLRSALQVGLCC